MRMYVTHARGILPMAALAREQGCQRIFVPQEDAAEAALIPDLEMIPAALLTALYQHFIGQVPISPQELVKTEELPVETAINFREVKGQEHVKRALEVAVAGGHNAFML
jgi:magnesium chelatase family protein